MNGERTVQAVIASLDLVAGRVRRARMREARRIRLRLGRERMAWTAPLAAVLAGGGIALAEGYAAMLVPERWRR